MTIILRNGFRLNTNLLETNVLNLAVVLNIVIKIVGDSLQFLLNQRQKAILSTLQEADLKAKKTKQRLKAAQRTFEEACLRVQKIRAKAIQTIEREEFLMQKQLRKDLYRLQERRDQTIQLEYQRTTQLISYQVFTLALTFAEDVLLKTLESQRTSSLKQKELNEMCVRKTFCQLKELKHLFFSNI